jgi:hypothetical protein
MLAVVVDLQVQEEQQVLVDLVAVVFLVYLQEQEQQAQQILAVEAEQDGVIQHRLVPLVVLVLSSSNSIRPNK